MIPKAGKDLKEAKNWRPISLSSCVSKLFECSIKECLEMEKRKRQIAENIHQAAYKKGRSTQEHILRLAEDVNHAFAKQECVIAVFLDVSGAFDRVWISGLMWKLLMMRLPLNLLCVIKGFLTSRSLRVKVDKIISDNVNMAAGTPQGAVLSPTLFNIFVDNLKKNLGIDENINLAQYADDVALWISDACPRRAEARMNKVLQRLAKWTCDWRIQLAPEKSVFIFFSRRPTHQRMTVRIELLGKVLQQVQSHRFLGVRFDEKLTWKRHVDEMIGSAIPRISALKSISAKSTWSHPERVIKLHDAVVNSIWKYGSVAYVSMNACLWDKLKKIHSSCVKFYCGVPSYTSYDTLCHHTGIKSI